jgi:sugar/nucleoside kinase (ribokinase family)
VSKKMQNLSISGIGCSLIDYIYTNINFNDPAILSYFSKKDYDGGLAPGGLVFTDELEKYTGLSFDQILGTITKGKKPEAINLGGPAIVALVNCTQLLNSLPVDVRYYGQMGNDETAEYVKNILKKMPLNFNNYWKVNGSTPSTYVFSDPDYDNGHGERMFVNNIGVAGNFTINDVPDHFFNSRILLFGATALLPNIHDKLSILLKKGKKTDCINIVTTVYDFRNAKKNPDSRWPLGDDDNNYKNIDLLITDYEEALRLSNSMKIDDAIAFFIKKQTPAFIITHGPNPVYIYSNGNTFKKNEVATLPVSKYVGNILKTQNKIKGDTTGCGDNFVGGVLSSIVYQLLKMESEFIDLYTACAWGIVSGGFTCFYMGGTYLEKYAGEKRKKIQSIFDKYRKQTENVFTFVHNNFY